MKEDLLNRCRWPELPEMYDRALRAAVAIVLDRFDVLGIVACGTIVRGTPDPSSDLDLYVLHRDSFRQRIQKFFHGVPTEIFTNSPESVELYLEEERARRRPVTAHMLATGAVVLDLDPIVEALRQRAVDELKNPPAPTQRELTTSRYTAALLYEDAVDVVERDVATAQLLLGRAVEEMLRHRFVQSGVYLPRAKDLFEELAELDAETAVLARRFFGDPDPAGRIELAGEIADRTIRARGFFEWESPRAEVK
jgi:predicted nucleotidyltransferase